MLAHAGVIVLHETVLIAPVAQRRILFLWKIIATPQMFGTKLVVDVLPVAYQAEMLIS
jgi:hypothetical protein